MNVRRASPADAQEIAEVHIASWRAAYPGVVPQPVLDGLDVDRRAAFWATHLTDEGESRTWVADDDGRLIGFAGTQPADPDDAPHVPAGSHELATLYTLPEAWGRGVGRALLDQAVTDLAADGIVAMHLWVFAANDRARAFYQRSGWREDGGARDIEIGGVPIPIVRYTRVLLEVERGG